MATSSFLGNLKCRLAKCCSCEPLHDYRLSKKKRNQL
ncbi:hypothetical protein JMJ77_0006265 [Colletotrichum scovillei]|uniref:Uncharacterized protein n=1 Tax=Colletotrichum scovillei TaxID=1209932 RepID=A0A9P7RID7_9PEZI|nr:hypothetical protein JMJ77_0006265 [Colletotrichum scovillei]KAG7077503.1 hypothetical protein JMJ76_0014749 [Colletotrichum scovillei]KAG7084635.1 hypothetical protein JMJ78_0010068 [Colletotrichum scovillei]